MPFFMVRCYDGGISDEKEARKIEAKTPLEAAEKICGGPLTAGGTPGQLRAVVWPLDKPNDTASFSRRDQ